MSNKITFGLRNVHYALATFAEDTWTFDTPKDLIGAQVMQTIRSFILLFQIVEQLLHLNSLNFLMNLKRISLAML